MAAYRDSGALRKAQEMRAKHILQTYNQAHRVFPKVGWQRWQATPSAVLCWYPCMQRLEVSRDANRGMSLQSQLLAPKAAPKADITVSCTAVVLNCSVLLLLLLLPAGQVCAEAQQPPGRGLEAVR